VRNKLAIASYNVWNAR